MDSVRDRLRPAPLEGLIMSGGGKAAHPYQPANQAGADQSYQNFINDITSAQSGQASTTQGLGAAATAVQNNPYYATAIQGANTVAGMAPQVAAGQQGA